MVEMSDAAPPFPEKAASGPAAESFPWASIIWFGLLLVGLFAETAYGMANEWFNNEEMGHGLFAPAIAGYLVWQDRDKLLNTPRNPSWAGLGLVVLGFLAMVVGIRGADYFIARMGLLVSLVGIIWTLAGTNILRAVWFPLFILLFMVRIPTFIYTQITFPLQLLASRVAEQLLTLGGIPVFRDGNILELPSQKLSVVEACSGIRSLMSLSLLSLVYGTLFDSRPWMRWALFALSAPIAIVVNALRVTMTGVMSEIDKDLASGPYHSAEGFVMWAMAVGLLLLAHKTISMILDRKQSGRPADPAGPKAAWPVSTESPS
jgi:exosortase